MDLHTFIAMHSHELVKQLDIIPAEQLGAHLPAHVVEQLPAQGVTVFAVLIPDARVDGTHSAAIHTIGMLSVHRGTSNIGPGQLETYTSVQLTGTAGNKVMAL